MKDQFKYSYYVVVSDPINEAGSCVLFSTRTGRELVASPAVLTCLQTNSLELIPEHILEKLKETKMIVPQDEDELLAVVNENKESIEDDTCLYEVIQPSAMCQLGCYYCGQKHNKDYVPEDLQDKMLARIRLKASTGQFKSLFIGWFGGEPLMALKQMRTLTPSLKAIAQEFGLKYGAKIVTNGLSLKVGIFEELVRDMAIKEFEITLDGVAEYHDKHRYTKEGGKSFDLIFNNLVNILNKPDYESHKCQISIRCNVDENNVDGVSPLIKMIADHGIHTKISHFYTMNVYSWGNDAHKKALTKEEFAQRELEWAIEMLQYGYKKVKFLPQRKKQVCFTVSKNSEMYDAYGNIFDCSETSYVPVYENTEYKLGTLSNDYDNLALKRSQLFNWNDTLLTDKFPCHTCKMLPVCGGACPKSWHEDMRACPTSKFNINDKLLLMYMLLRRETQEIDKLKQTQELYSDKAWVRAFSQLNDRRMVEA
jgi:uncharacterized protein